MMIANGFESLGELNHHHAKLLREAETQRLLRGNTTGRLVLDRLSLMSKLYNRCRSGRELRRQHAHTSAHG